MARTWGTDFSGNYKDMTPELHRLFDGNLSALADCMRSAIDLCQDAQETSPSPFYSPRLGWLERQLGELIIWTERLHQTYRKDEAPEDIAKTQEETNAHTGLEAK